MTAVLLVTNRAAGTASDEHLAAATAALREGFDLTDVASETPEELREHLSGFDGDHVVVAGGDGSLHTLINALGDLGRLADTVVSLVPLGTGNDFATGLSIPDDPVAAAEAILRGSPQPVDVIASGDGELVVNAAHAGIGAVAAERAQAAKPVAGKLAYPLGALQAGASEPGYQLRVTLDGDLIHDGLALFVLAANGPCLGGGAQLCVGADPTDGVIDVLLIDALEVYERPGLALDIRRGTHLERDDVHSWRGRELDIRGEAVDHNRDGELLHGLDAVTYTIQPGAWNLRGAGSRGARGGPAAGEPR